LATQFHGAILADEEDFLTWQGGQLVILPLRFRTQTMPLSTAIIGRQTKSFERHVEARWLMAYAAGLPDVFLHGTATLAPAF
jgi:hypothetical protein